MLIKLEKVWVSPNYQNGKLLLITKCKYTLIKVYNSFMFFFSIWYVLDHDKDQTNNSLWCPYGKRKTWQKSWRIDWVYGYQLFCHLGNKTEALDDILSSLCFVEGDEKKIISTSLPITIGTVHFWSYIIILGTQSFHKIFLRSSNKQGRVGGSMHFYWPNYWPNK